MAAKKKSAKTAGRSPGKSSRPAAKKAAAKKKVARKAGAPKRVKAIPDGYHSVTPYLHLSGAAKAIDFYKRAFGAKEKVRMGEPGGRVAHAELEIGNSVVMMADEFPEMGHQSPQTIGGTGGSILLYVPDVDATFAKAIKAGAKAIQGVTDQFYGDRSGYVEDPWGHRWTIATHTEDVSPEEMAKRMASMQQPG